MNRLALYIAGISAAIATVMMLRDRYTATGPTRRVPVKKAAEMLQQAWADHHTVA